MFHFHQITRQMFSIILSCLLYGHVITPNAGLGACVVFMALLLQTYAKWRIRQRQTAGKQPVAGTA